jgi:hypothetical protein
MGHSGTTGAYLIRVPAHDGGRSADIPDVCVLYSKLNGLRGEAKKQIRARLVDLIKTDER